MFAEPLDKSKWPVEVTRPPSTLHFLSRRLLRHITHASSAGRRHAQSMDLWDWPVLQCTLCHHRLPVWTLYHVKQLGGGSEVHKSLASGPFQRKNLHLSPVKAKGGQHSRAVPSIAIITSQSFNCKHELVFGPKADLCIYVHR